MSAVMTPAQTIPPAAVAAGGWEPFRWTVEQYRQLSQLGLFEDVKVMLIDGEIFTMTAPNPPHDTALGLTEDWLRSVFTTGYHVRSQKGFDVGTRHGPEPDLAVVPGSIRDYASRTPNTAVLVIEVAETSLNMDTTTKAELYATARVPEYWVIDLVNRRLLVYRDPEPLPTGLGATAYRTHHTFGPSDSVAPLAAPAATIRIADLLP
jgi:Uma2 family endonuclease